MGGVNIDKQDELIQLAKTISIDERKNILISFKETDLHVHIKELLGKMDSNNLIEITHGSEEHGNDLVMVKNDVFREIIIGVIVKVGNIGAKTKGKTDEIKSQVEQSLAHPVILKSIPDRILNISEVWIMISGNLTKGAYGRLEKEVMTKGNNIRIDFGIDWLVENFTNYYPQVFYEGMLMDFLADKILQLESSESMFTQRGKTLTDCFVDPLISDIGVPEKFDDETYRVIIEKQRFPFHKLKKIIKSGSKIIIFGDPGVGKSIALNKYVLDQLREAWASAIKKELSNKMEIPIKITASKFLTINSCEELIHHCIDPYTEIYNRINVTTLIVDGLDEVPSTNRDELLDKAKDFSKQFGCSLIISTRKTDLVKNPPEGFERCELLPFNYSQAIELYNKLILDQNILNALKKGLESIRYQVPMTPLSLFLLLKIVEARKEVPASITELYDQFSDIMLGKYDLEKGIMVLFEYHIKKKFLAELAFKEFFEKKRLEMLEIEFKSFLKNYANIYGWDEEQLVEFTWEIERAGILIHKKNMISFSHSSFLDYFGAFHIWDTREKIENLEDFIVKIYFEDFWRDVAFFYIGLQRKIEISLLNKIFEYPKEDLTTYAEKFLTGRLLQAGWHSTADAMFHGLQGAISYSPIIKEKFSKMIEKSEKPVPKILPDFLVMIMSDLSFGSMILLDKGESLFNSLASKPSYQNSYMMLSLLWSYHRFMSRENIQKSMNIILDVVEKIPESNIEEKAKIISLLMFISQEDETFIKILQKKQVKIIKNSPEIFKRLLGVSKKKGFRKKSDKLKTI